MRIGLVRRGFSPTGGAEAYLLRLAAELSAKGHEVILFSDVRWPDSTLRSCQPPLTLCNLENATTTSGRKLRVGPAHFSDWLRDTLARSACELVISLERVHECDAYRAGDGVHAAWLERRAKFEPRWRAWLRRFSGKHRELLDLERALFTGGARIIIANSRLVKDEIIAHFGTPAERIHVVHNGVPPWRDEPGLREQTRAALALGEHDYGVLFAGSGWERKGLRHAIAAANATPSATLLVAGKGRRRGLPQLARGRFLGAQSAAEMRGLLAAADAFILPTIYDPFSNACLEALTAGLPVITTTANGFAEVIEAGVEGEVVGPGDIPALTAALRKWADAGKRNAVRDRLRAKGAELSVEANVSRTLGILLASNR
jgi:UDP-glucose:(heptosyl)LPS alpha-1,3-glucosyltransferase